jgi:DhnA family fructose-bisphosphate aldolase class Ia
VHKTRRLSRITAADGKALIVAMDHAAIMGPSGLERPAEVIRQITAGGADAVLTTYGLARAFSRELAPLGLILRSDGAVTMAGPDWTSAAPIYGVEDALRLGADGIAATTGPGHKNEREQLAWLAKLSSECDRWGLVLMGEMVPGGFESGPELRTLEHHRRAARLGSELGCDLVKMPYCDDFAQVTGSCYTPIVVLGGSRMALPDLLRLVHSAMQVGAIGCAIGRNIWGAPDPAAVTAALATIIHGGASVEDALALLAETKGS